MTHHKPTAFIDQIFSHLDHGLRSTFIRPSSNRASPADAISSDPIDGQPLLRDKSAALMRVNHVGEVCAQALYQGQALTSRSSEVKEKMNEAAEEEIDHLNWCYQRIEQLDSHTSYLNPIWYLGSFALGLGAGLAGDKWSLGFLAETERQVVEHLESHLERLPEEDTISRAIVTQMAEDEAKHAQMAIDNGAAELPEFIKKAMKQSARLMTQMSERI
ncbi:MAG: ubiquinone biosynthesis monooxygenase Coq7 [Arenicella sp.]|jgi:ubiquinone biosynthesis monooxygenase Coq7